VGAGVVGRHLDRGWGDVRVLGDREGEQGDAAGQYDDDGQHRGEDWPVDEKAREHGSMPHFRITPPGSPSDSSASSRVTTSAPLRPSPPWPLDPVAPLAAATG